MVGDASASSQTVGTTQGDVDDVDLPNPGLDALATPGDDFPVVSCKYAPTVSNYENPAAPGGDSLVIPGAGDHAPEIVGDNFFL